jgi:hypothetical protein
MKKAKLVCLSAGVAVAALLISGAARAQTDAAAPSAAPAVSSSSSSGGGNGIGVGATETLSGIPGATGVAAAEFVYDQSMFHITGDIGFSSAGSATPMGARATNIFIGVSGWYHLHHGASSDFSLGGGVGFLSASAGGVSAQAFSIEPGAMARVFITSNFALFGRAGLAMVFGDNTGPLGNASSVAFGGQTTSATGGFGFTYFFR